MKRRRQRRNTPDLPGGVERSYTVKQVAAKESTSEQFIWRRLWRGEFDPYLRLGNSKNSPVRIPESSYLAWRERHKFSSGDK